MHICPICDNPIIEKKDGQKGHDSVYCEGQCQVWLHRHCASLSKAAFQAVSQSQLPFLCTHCRLDAQEKEVAVLKATMTTILAETETQRNAN